MQSENTRSQRERKRDRIRRPSGTCPEWQTGSALTPATSEAAQSSWAKAMPLFLAPLTGELLDSSLQPLRDLLGESKQALFKVRITRSRQKSCFERLPSCLWEGGRQQTAQKTKPSPVVPLAGSGCKSQASEVTALESHAGLLLDYNRQFLKARVPSKLAQSEILLNKQPLLLPTHLTFQAGCDPQHPRLQKLKCPPRPTF